MPSSALRLRELRALQTLTGECRELGDDHALWREHWFRRLGELTGAELVVGGDVTVGPGGSVVGECTVGVGWENGFDPTVIPRTAAEYGHKLAISPFLAAYFQRPQAFDGCGLTRTDLLGDRAWYRSAYYRMVHTAIGVDHALVSFFAPPGRAGVCSGITLSRGKGVRRDFAGRHRAVVREAQVGLAPLIGGPLARHAEPSPSALPPRVRQVLRCLLEGDSDKQVSLRLGISRHTVNQYVKAVFLHFGLTTRTELLARWVRRGWGIGPWAADDVPPAGP